VKSHDHDHADNQRNQFPSSTSLDLETTRPSATTSTLELAALAGDVGLLVGVGTEAEVLDGLTGVLGSTEEESVGSSGVTSGNLVNGEGLTTGLLNAGTGGSGEAEGCDGELGELEQTVVVSDGSDNDDGLALVSLSGVLVGSGCDDLGQADGRAVDLGHHEASQNRLVEGGLGTTGKELVQAHQQLDVRVGGLRDLCTLVNRRVLEISCCV